MTWIGLGSNVLIRDGGLRGTVIFTGPGLSCVETRGDDRMYVEAGVPCAKAARLAARAGLPGGEFLAGIPGTVGGALAMNAGAFGGEIWTLVTQVETVARDGQLRLRPSADYSVGYRTVRGPLDEWFVSCELRFVATATRDSGSRIRELLAQRNANQPQGVASCGSVFKNPPGDFAGRLIEAAGLKGARCGGCHVSHKHANFIINDDDATAADIERLITLVRAQVAEKFGVFLEPEVRILGEPAAAQSAGRGNE